MSSLSFLQVEDLRTTFHLSGSFSSRLAGRAGASITAVDGVSLVVERGETYGVIGESGSGKTTLGRSILRLVEPTSGKVMLDGRDILGLSPRDFRPYRRRMQIVFQDPQAALSPAMTVGSAVAHPLIIHGLAGREEARRQAGEMLERVGLEPAGRFLNAYPTDLSGGQKQRAVIARALMLGPELVVADEPVSMLDASVRTKILSLLLDLQRSLGLTYVFITHDLATARFVCDSIAIMYLGQVVEQGPARAVYAEPRHPYTKALLAAVPQPDPSKRAKKEIPGGEIPDAASPPAHCRFHPRCPRAFAPCGFEAKDLVDALEARWTGLGEEAFASERALLGRLLPHRRTLTILPGGGGSVEEVVRLLEQLREEGTPAFRTIQSITSERGVVAVEVPAGRDPEPVAVGGTLVACHLYPEGDRSEVR
jgi:oligopeptide/dipeptide ABC transporter ATP-binding protein